MPEKPKRIGSFSREAFKMGVLSGFKHFRVEVRGREELLVTVNMDDPKSPTRPKPPQHTPTHHGHRPTQHTDDGDEGLPPASPAQREGYAPRWKKKGHAVFLIGSYAHYGIPLVWVRSGHEKLSCFGAGEQHDQPIKLSSTSLWEERFVHAWEVLAELVERFSPAAPHNPFELTPGFADGLPPTDALLLNCGLVALISDIALSDAKYATAVEADLLELQADVAARLEKLANQPYGTVSSPPHRSPDRRSVTRRESVESIVQQQQPASKWPNVQPDSMESTSFMATATATACVSGHPAPVPAPVPQPHYGTQATGQPPPLQPSTPHQQHPSIQHAILPPQLQTSFSGGSPTHTRRSASASMRYPAPQY